jgi:hypothetical protein
MNRAFSNLILRSISLAKIIPTTASLRHSNAERDARERNGNESNGFELDRTRHFALPFMHFGAFSTLGRGPRVKRTMSKNSNWVYANRRVERRRHTCFVLRRRRTRCRCSDERSFAHADRR